MQHIDPEFTNEMVPGSVGVASDFPSSLAASCSNAFKGFSYVSTEDYLWWEIISEKKL